MSRTTRSDLRTRRYSALGAGLLVAALSSPPVAGELPEGVAPLSPERQAELQELVEEAVALRDLTPGERMPVGQQGVEELERFLAATLDEELPAAEVPGIERLLRWFGLVPEDLSLPEFFVDLLSSQIAGYYDPESGYLVVVDGPASMAAAFADQPALAERMDHAVLLHEIVHYLQDEHFDLETFLDGEALADEALARQALVEGDATLAMYSYIMGADIERIGFMAPVFESLLRDPASLIEMAPDLPGAEELIEAPAYFRETLIFPYLRGLLFNLELRRRGGTKLVDYAFRRDPPRSSEQILHPEKWLDARDEPVVLQLPAVAAIGPGTLTLVEEGSWGELGIRVVLAESLPDAPPDVVDTAAAGWGGDRYALYDGPGRHYLAWVTEWDLPADADEFANLVEVGFVGWRVERPSPTRVVLVDSAVDDPASDEPARDGSAEGELESTLAAVFSTLPGRRDEGAAIDLDAIGVTLEDVPEPLGILELMKLAEDPTMGELFQQGAELGQQGAFDEMMADPEIQAEIVEMFTDLSPEEMQELMESPAMQQLLEQQREAMLANRPEVAVADGVLTVAALGVRLTLPPGDEWVVTDDPSLGTTQILHPAGAGLLVTIVPVPAGAPLAAVISGLDAQLLVNGFEKTLDELGEYAGHPSYRATFEHPSAPRTLDVRFIHIGGQGLSLTAVRGEGAPEAVVEALMAAFDDVAIGPAAP